MSENEIHVTLPGGTKADAHYKGFVIKTDQPVHEGGENSAPSPFDLFLASLATCAGYFVAAFCQERKIPTEEITLTMAVDRPKGSRLIAKIAIVIHLPKGFPDKYRAAVIKAAESCTVKIHLAHPSEFLITTD